MAGASQKNSQTESWIVGHILLACIHTHTHTQPSPSKPNLNEVQTLINSICSQKKKKKTFTVPSRPRCTCLALIFRKNLHNYVHEAFILVMNWILL